MNRPLDAHPTSDAEVFDMLHSLFGLGDYNDDDDKPWHKYRMVEISKIKAIRLKRRWSFGDFAMVARYCHRHRIPIAKTWDLVPQFGHAKVELVADIRTRRDDRVTQAVAMERQLHAEGYEQWVAWLELSSGRGREELLEEWAEFRKRTLEDLADAQRRTRSVAPAPEPTQ